MCTPALKAASIRLVPASTSTVRASMVTLGTLRGSVLEVAAVGERAGTVADVLLDPLREALDQRIDRTDRGLRQRAEGGAVHVLADRPQQLRIARPPLAVLDAGEQQLHPVGALAAGGALAARLGVEELAQPGNRAHHAGGVVHHHHRRRAE